MECFRSYSGRRCNSKRFPTTSNTEIPIPFTSHLNNVLVVTLEIIGERQRKEEKEREEKGFIAI